MDTPQQTSKKPTARNVGMREWRYLVTFRCGHSAVAIWSESIPKNPTPDMDCATCWLAKERAGLN